jgi:hypothetical protein
LSIQATGKLLICRRKSGRISAPKSGIRDVALAAAAQPMVYA